MTIGSLPESQEAIDIVGKESKESKRQGTMQPYLKLIWSGSLDKVYQDSYIPHITRLLVKK